MMTKVTGYVPNGRGGLQIVERQLPSLRSDQVLIRIRAFGINRADLLQVDGKYSALEGVTDILGLEAAGDVVEAGSGVDRAWIGKRICVLLSGGAYADYAICTIHHSFELPADWTYAYGAAIPETFLTAYLNLFLEGAAASGESVLIHGGGSGVGTAAIQLAVAANLTVNVTAGTDEKCRRCLALGAHRAINYTTEDFVDRLGSEARGEGVDLILDCIGASYFSRNIEILRTKGRLVCIALQGGAKTEADLRPILTRRLTLKGSVLRSRRDDEKAKLCSHFRQAFWGSLVDGSIHPVIDSEYHFSEVAEAQLKMKNSAHFGKIVVVNQ